MNNNIIHITKIRKFNKLYLASNRDIHSVFNNSEEFFKYLDSINLSHLITFLDSVKRARANFIVLNKEFKLLESTFEIIVKESEENWDNIKEEQRLELFRSFIKKPLDILCKLYKREKEIIL